MQILILCTLFPDDACKVFPFFVEKLYRVKMNRQNSALTFDGLIYNIDDILIDNFESLKDPRKNKEKYIKYCIISHAHNDHYNGLSSIFENEYKPLFLLTKTTMNLILEQNKGNQTIINNLANCKYLSMDKEYNIENNLKITFIPNYNCLGSVMILIKDSRNRLDENVILYTGDARFESNVIESIKMSSFLLPYIFENSRINMLYLDTTFSYRDENIEILNNIKGIQIFIELIKTYPKGTIFNILDTAYGFEEVWQKLYTVFKDTCNFHVSKKVQKWLDQILCDDECGNLEKFINLVDRIQNFQKPSIDKDQIQYNFYIGDIEEFDLSKSDDIVVTAKHAIELTKYEYENVCLPATKDCFIKFEKEGNLYNCMYNHKNGGKDEIYTGRYFEHNDKFYPVQIKYMYSRHSSCTETQKFVDLFKNRVGDIYPLTESYKSWKRGFTMYRYYGIVNSKYDFLSTQKYGRLNDDSIDDTDISVIDYWKNETKNLDTVSTDTDHQIDIIGQAVGNKGEYLSYDKNYSLVFKEKDKRAHTQKQENRTTDRFLLNAVDGNGPENRNEESCKIEGMDIIFPVDACDKSSETLTDKEANEDSAKSWKRLKISSDIMSQIGNF